MTSMPRWQKPSRWEPRRWYPGPRLLTRAGSVSSPTHRGIALRYTRVSVSSATDTYVSAYYGIREVSRDQIMISQYLSDAIERSDLCRRSQTKRRDHPGRGDKRAAIKAPTPPHTPPPPTAPPFPPQRGRPA